MLSNGTDRHSRGGTRILVVRLSSMGDVIHALPAAARLKTRLPDAELSWAIDPGWAGLLKDNPYVDRVIEVPLRRWRAQAFQSATWREFRAFRETLREQRFDLAIDFQGLLKSAFVTCMSRAERVFGFDRKVLREPLAASFYSNRITATATHVVDRNLELAAEALAGVGVESPAIAADRDEQIRFPLPAGVSDGRMPDGDFVLATPMAGWESKQWPLDRFSELAAILYRETGMPLVINSAPADRPKVEAIVQVAPADSCRLYESSIEGLIAATRKARAVLGVDSGPLHLAAAVRVPGVALFGPTSPERNGPYGSTFRVLRSPDAVTSYEHRDGIDPSMESLQPREVWAALESVLGREPSAVELTERVPTTP